MKIGISSYSLNKAIRAGELDLPGTLSWAAENGAEHVEITPMQTDLTCNPELVETLVRRSRELGVELSGYTIGANFVAESEEAFLAEIERVKRHVEVAAALGVKRMRHDVASRPVKEASVARFEADLPRLIHACREVADHARSHGVVTSVENHGYHMQASERVVRLVEAVDRENFRVTIDIGNFLCVDEEPLLAVANVLPLASIVHFKDFYRRRPESDPGTGWFRSKAGYHLRGAIVGHGDIDIAAVARLIKGSGFDGFVSLEFEGMEDCRTGAKIGLENLRRYLA
ncbi:MAG TPA: sugar phosphate isomerase/epimerase family protein [Chthoniobacteraceae bacterium]|nr:sugar phosphate isomerase/epimerase family protein [Chthoniobacteraceae bacterium]